MKRALLQELLELTKTQKELLEKEEVDRFIELIQHRQDILDKLQELYIKNPELKEQDDSDLLDELKKVDNENREEFEGQFEEVKRKLRETRLMRKNEIQYSNPYDISREEGVFFDKRNR